MAALSTSTWGDPAATKRVLLIHGITSSSQTWFRIGQDFASRGCFVVAPDLLGHGNARRGSDYTIAALAQELGPLFATPMGDDHPFDIVVGHSLGGVVTAALLPLLKSTRSVKVVLSDPPLQPSPETSDFYRKLIVDVVTNLRTPEAYLQEFPTWTKEEAVMRSFAACLCDSDAVHAILDQNIPWSFLHYLSNVPDNVRVIVLCADPSKVPCARAEDYKPHPHVLVRTVWGASHMIPFDHPSVVVETALGGIEAQN